MMRTGVTISSIGHAAILAWSVLTFAAKPNEAKPLESMPVDIISASELSQITAGARDAKAAAAKPMVEKVAERSVPDDPIAKLAAKEIKAATDAPPVPEVKPPPKPEPKKAEPKHDLIAEALKKDETKKPEPKKAEPKTPTPPTPPKQQTEQQPKFDPRKVEALLDKRVPQRLAAAGDTLNRETALGAANGMAAQLSLSELDAFRKRIEECWNPPTGVDNTAKVHVVIRVLFNSDGSVAKSPDVVSGTASPLGPAMAESAKRAILRCQPFKMLKPEHYDQWKDIEITFDPQTMIRG
jgi:outer membrane biosynthesis protein TonB